MATLWQLRLLSEVVVRANWMTRRKDGTLNRWLSDSLEKKVPANAKPVQGVSTMDVIIDAEAGIWARLFIPTQEMEVTPLQTAADGTQSDFTKKLPVIFYYHGGGFAVLCPNHNMYDKFCRRLARTCGAVVISVHYRRSPEHKFPVAYDDSYKAFEWLQSEEATPHMPPNVDYSRVFLSGDSAGGNIAHHVALRAAGKDLGRVKLKGLIIIQGFFGGEERTPAELQLKNVPIVSVDTLDWHWKAYLPKDANRDHPACNIFGPNSQDLSQIPFPPVLNIIGKLDILQDWEQRYSEGMKKAGKEVQTLVYEDGIHTFGLLNQVKLAPQMLVDIVNFINAQQ
ncbi:hypothetical protein KC19_1G243700 [Ceratodon purpureus]|uniref:Alpha/beta hydrolase fold-3 domain-containing protein n=1 Tax=Ceratodon purpureus TaxID=3225 RepID=A0A8T0J8T7_CERPU|nr:hypothetical protein KC19_1G243700 [Ceratodon purpureus]